MQVSQSLIPKTGNAKGAIITFGFAAARLWFGPICSPSVAGRPTYSAISQGEITNVKASSIDIPFSRVKPSAPCVPPERPAKLSVGVLVHRGD
jgi:hypothetical protein